MAETERLKETAEAEVTEHSFLDAVLEGYELYDVAAEEDKKKIERAVSDLSYEVLKGLTFARDVEASIEALVRQIDERVSEQLNEVIHHEKFQKLESSWRGLSYLLEHSAPAEDLKIRVMSISKSELMDDLTAGPATGNVDRSQLFKKIHQEEYNVFGGTPFGAMMGDFEFDHSGRDMKLLTRMSQLGAMAHMPFLSGVSPKMFGYKDFTPISDVYEMTSAFESGEYAQWNAFRASEDSRYVALALPRMLIREPYGPDTVKEFHFEEDVTGKEHNRYLWANAAWGLGAIVNRAFSENGWCVRIRGPESGGLVEGLPTHAFKTDTGDTVMKCPTETILAEDQEYELSKLGFAALANKKNTAEAVFFNVHSAQKPKEYIDNEANINAQLAAQLPYLFAACRFSHYLKKMVLNWVGSYQTKEKLEKTLRTWIAQFVLLKDPSDATDTEMAKQPLSGADIQVVENPREPGVFQAVGRIRPHFQMDRVDFSLRLVANVPKKK